MDNKGFTLIELLAVLIVVALLTVIAIPTYMNVYSDVKASNYHNKVLEIENAASKYGEKIKDDIKDAEGSCVSLPISTLIKKGYLKSEDKKDNVINNPVTGKPFDQKIDICYCASSYQIKSFYLEEFNESTSYLIKTKVREDGKMYVVTKDYNITEITRMEQRTNSKKRGINAKYVETASANGKKVEKRYFSEIKC